MSDQELIARLREGCSCNIHKTPCWAETECRDYFAAADRIEAQAAEIERLRGDLAKAEWLLVDASVQLEEGRIKTRRNRASLIRQFLAELKGDQP